MVLVLQDLMVLQDNKEQCKIYQMKSHDQLRSCDAEVLLAVCRRQVASSWTQRGLVVCFAVRLASSAPGPGGAISVTRLFAVIGGSADRMFQTICSRGWR